MNKSNVPGIVNVASLFQHYESALEKREQVRLTLANLDRQITEVRTQLKSHLLAEEDSANTKINRLLPPAPDSQTMDSPTPLLKDLHPATRKVMRALVKAFPSGSDPFKVSDLAAACKISKNTSAFRISKAEQLGIIRRIERGVYQTV